MSYVLNSRYELRRQIGKGSFGEIWLARDLVLGEKVAVKLEAADSAHPQLMHEAKVLQKLQGGPGLPQIQDVGCDGENVYMAMDLLGPTVQELFTICKKRLSPKTVAMIGEQVLCRLHFIHSHHYIHRDIKPENLLIGPPGHDNLVYVVDFGLAKKFRDKNTEVHINYADGKFLAGTTRYVSLNTHLGIEHSRRDDIEGLAYVLIYLIRGALPWQHVEVQSKFERHRKIMEQKLHLSLAEICEGVPTEIADILTYARGMTFQQLPDYSFLRKSLRNLISRIEAQYDYRYDWTGLRKYEELIVWKSDLERRQAENPIRPKQDENSSCIIF